VFARVKEHLRGKHCEPEDDLNTAVTDSLHCLSKDKYKAAIDCLPRKREECVDSAVYYIQ
jgi:hypothetical protein